MCGFPNKKNPLGTEGKEFHLESHIVHAQPVVLKHQGIYTLEFQTLESAKNIDAYLSLKKLAFTFKKNRLTLTW